MVDRQGADIDLLAIARPWNCRVVGWIAGLADRDDHVPFDRRPFDARDHGVEEIVLVLCRGLSRRFRFERLGCHHRPTNRRGGAGGVDEAKRIEAVIAGVRKSGGERLGLYDLQRPTSFRVAREKVFHFRRVRLARHGVRLRGEQLIIESLGVFDDEYWYVDHRRPPLLAVGWAKAEPHRAHRRRTIGHVGLAAGERETPDDRDPSTLENRGLGEAHPLPVAVEVTSDARALGMIAAETWPNAINLFEPVDHPRLGQAMRREPAADKGKASHHNQDGGTDYHQPGEGSFVDQRLQPIGRGAVRTIWHRARSLLHRSQSRSRQRTRRSAIPILSRRCYVLLPEKP